MRDLELLIIKLKHGIEKKSSYIKSIRNPRLLVNSLIELNSLIGNNKIKDSVAIQISHLIMNKRRISLDNDIEDDVMLNAVLYGEPGVGKTLIGTKLAKIWYSLGYLKGNKNTNNFTNYYNLPNNTDDDNIYIILFIIFLIWILSLTWNFYTNYGGFLTSLIIIIFFIIAIIIIYNLYNTNNSNKNNDKPLDKNKNMNEKYTQPADDCMIKVVSRADFVGKYVGHTAQITNKLLEDNLGKVLFVDESYSLLQSMDDSFGMEALTALNLFLSNHPNEIIVIFAGYRDLLEAGPFTAQPGLKRRFMWQFDCEGYTIDELFDIFKYKLNKKKLNLENEENTKQLFIKYYDCFPNYGGDIEKTIFFSCLEQSRDFMNNENLVDINTLNTNQIERGILKLIDNNITSYDTEDDTINPMANLMNVLKSNNTIKRKVKSTSKTSKLHPDTELLHK